MDENLHPSVDCVVSANVPMLPALRLLARPLFTLLGVRIREVEVSSRTQFHTRKLPPSVICLLCRDSTCYRMCLLAPLTFWGAHMYKNVASFFALSGECTSEERS
jgi:hypothetical protein